MVILFSLKIVYTNVCGVHITAKKLMLKHNHFSHLLFQQFRIFAGKSADMRAEIVNSVITNRPHACLHNVSLYF